MVIKALPITKKKKLMDKLKFAKVPLDKDS